VGPAGQAGGGPEEKLTDRELEVLRLFGEGWSTEEIAGRLHLSPKTVEVHRGHIKEKLGLKITPEFTRFASAGLPHKAGQRASNATLGQTIVGTSPATPRSCFRLLRKFLVYHSPTAIAPVRVHLAAYVEVSIFPIGHDFAALSADDFPANSPRVQAGDNEHA